MKRKYIKPQTERIQVQCEGFIMWSAKLKTDKTNLINDKNTWSESTEDFFGKGAGTVAPSTFGDYDVNPGSDIPGTSKTNPWDEWD